MLQRKLAHTVVSVHVSASMSVTQLDQGLWSQVWNQVNSILGGEKLQLVYPFIEWSWPIAQPGYIDATAYSIVGQIPKWSTVGRYSASSDDFHSNYMQVLRKCPKLTNTPAQQQQLKEADDQITAAMRQQTKNRDAAKYAYEQAKQSGEPPTEYEEWLITSVWKAILEADEAATKEASETKKQIVSQLNSDHREAIEAATMPTDPNSAKDGFSKCNINGVDEWRPQYIIPNRQDWVAQLTRGGRNPLKIHLESSVSSISGEKSDSWAGSASGQYGFQVFVRVNDSWQDIKLNESNTDISIDININSVSQVPVRPGQWFKSGYLASLAKYNHWVEPFTTQGGSSPVFGKGGMLPLMVTGMIVGYQISVDISMPSSSSTLMESNGICIGPFTVEGSQWKEIAESKWSLSSDSKAQYPFIMGVIVDIPGSVRVLIIKSLTMSGPTERLTMIKVFNMACACCNCLCA